MSRPGVYGYAVRCEAPLTRLRSVPAPRGELAVRLADRLPSPPGAAASLVDGPEVRIDRQRDGKLRTWCRWSGEAVLDGDRAEIVAVRDGDARAWEDRLLNMLVGLLLAERGELVVHAAAVQGPRGAVVLYGPSGRGKSTLAAALGDRGLAVLSEDVTVLEDRGRELVAWPGPRGVRLGAGDVRGKRLDLPDGDHGGAVPVAALVRLERRGGGRLDLAPIDRAAALASLFPCAVWLGREHARRVFPLAAEAVRHARCFAARLPDSLGRLPTVAERLLSELGR